MLELNKIYNMDFLDGIKQIDDNSIDLIVTDPPYNTNYRSNYGSKAYQDRIQTAYKWDNNFNFKPALSEFMRILKPDSYCLVFGCEENIPLMKELGCYQILVWDKCHTEMGDLSDFGIGYEFIFYFKKGNPKLRGKRINGVLNIMHTGHFENSIHPTQKPESIISLLINKCSDINGVVFDAFLGSGTTALCALKLNRHFIGFEIDKAYFEIAENRIKGWKCQTRLTAVQQQEAVRTA